MRTRLQALLSGTAIITAIAAAGWMSTGAVKFANADPISPEQQAALSQALALPDVQAALAALPETIRTQVTQALTSAQTTEALAASIGQLVNQNAALASQVQSVVGAVANAPISTPSFTAFKESVKVEVTQTLQSHNIQVSTNLQPTGANLPNIQPAAGPQQQQTQVQTIIIKSSTPSTPSNALPGNSTSVLAPPSAGNSASNGQG